MVTIEIWYIDQIQSLVDVFIRRSRVWQYASYIHTYKKTYVWRSRLLIKHYAYVCMAYRLFTQDDLYGKSNKYMNIKLLFLVIVDNENEDWKLEKNK